MKELKKNFYCGDEVDYDDKCLEQCDRCVDATGVDYGYIEEVAIINYKKLYEGEPLTQDVPIDAFKQGAKWQQERSYSEEEVLNKLTHFAVEIQSQNKKGVFPLRIKEWFERNKNK